MAHAIERLENRCLLTPPELVAVLPNVGSFLLDGQTRTEAPKELTVRFSPGQTIDPASLGGIVITRAGFDADFEESSVYFDFNTSVPGPGAVVEFDAQRLGSGGDGIQITVTKAPLGLGITPTVSANVAAKTISIVLNSNATTPTSAQGLVDAINNNVNAASLVKAVLKSGPGLTDITTPAAASTVLTTSGANAAFASSGFNTVGSLEVLFRAVTSGTPGNGISLVFNKADLGTTGGTPAISVSTPPVTYPLTPRTITVTLNTNAVAGNNTTAQKLVTAINNDPVAKTLVQASIPVGGVAAGNDISTPTVINPLTLGGADDVTLTPGFVTVSDTNSNEVIYRFADTLPNDKYRLEVLGVAPGTLLRNIGNEVFSNGKDARLTFDLDLGAKITAVVPQPVLRDKTITVGSVANLRNGDRIFLTAGGTSAILELEDTTIGDGVLPGNIAVNFTNVMSANAIATAIAAAIPGALDVSVPAVGAGSVVTLQGNAFNPGVRIVTSQLGALAIADAGLTRRGSVIDVYFNSDVLSTTGGAGGTNSATNPNFYQLVYTQDTVQNTDDVVFTPATVTYDAGTNSAKLVFASDIDALVGAGAGSYRLRIGTDERVNGVSRNGVGTAITFPVAVTPVTDAASSFATAADLSTAAYSSFTFGLDATGRAKTIIVSSEVKNSTSGDPAYTLTYPGSGTLDGTASNVAEPGDRDIPVEFHNNNGPDANNDIGPTLFYNFQSNIGVYQSTQLLNQITEAQKQRSREIFELYGRYLGVKFIETADLGIIVATGDLRAFDPNIPDTTEILGLGSASKVVMNATVSWNNEYGASGNTGWFGNAMHEIGHSIGLGHSYELPQTVMGAGEVARTPMGALLQWPGPYDIVHGQELYRPDSKDIDLYKFTIAANTRGVFTAETIAERQFDSSGLDTYLRLYRESPTTGVRELIAGNDDYFSKDSYLELELAGGTATAITYYIGISASGNSAYDPTIPDSGLGGKSEGKYDLRMNFRPTSGAGAANSIFDATGVSLDGDNDNQAGGAYNFWFTAQSAANTLYVDARGRTTATAAGGTGALATPFNTISGALAAAVPGQIVRIVGNGGADNNLATINDNVAYLIGQDQVTFATLQDGATLSVPGSVTVMMDAGVIIKERNAIISVGSASSSVDQSRSALQVLGTPTDSVYLTSWEDATIGRDDNTGTNPAIPGQWGGIVFRTDNDRAAGRFDYEDRGEFLNYVNHAVIRYGGGTVTNDSTAPQPRVSPIHLIDSRPTVTFNTIQLNGDAAISADPNSFRETNFNAPANQLFSTTLLAQAPAGSNNRAFALDYSRVGPEIRGNSLTKTATQATNSGTASTALTVLSSAEFLAGNSITIGSNAAVQIASVNSATSITLFSAQTWLANDTVVNNSSLNSVNGMAVRSDTVPVTQAGSPGGQTKQLTVSGRFDDTDIVHVVSENLIITGTPSGAFRERTSAERPPVTLVTSTPAAAATSLGAGTYNYRIVFVDADGNEGIASNVTSNVTIAAGDQVTLANLPNASGIYLSRRLYRSNSSADSYGQYTLVTALNSVSTSYVDTGLTAGGLLAGTSGTRPSLAAIGAAAAAGGTLNPGTYNYRMTFVDIAGNESPSSAISANTVTTLANGTINLTTLPSVPVGGLYVGRRLYRSQNTGAMNGQYDLIATPTTTQASNAGAASASLNVPNTAAFVVGDVIVIGANAPVAVTAVTVFSATTNTLTLAAAQTWSLGDVVADTNVADTGLAVLGTLSTQAFRDRPRMNGSLTIDPTVVVKLNGARLELGMGSRLSAEGTDGQPVIFTATADDRYGAGGTFDTNSASTTAGAGQWSGIYAAQNSKLDIDYARVSFAGGISKVQGGFAGFNTIEIHQADARIAHTLFESNGTGLGGAGTIGGLRVGHENHDGESATIFVQYSQPVFFGNTFRDRVGDVNAGSPVMNFDVNSLNQDLVGDPGRATYRGLTGPIDPNDASDRYKKYGAVAAYKDNRGPLVRENLLNVQGINGMKVRGGTVTVQSVWDDADIPHIVFNTIDIDNTHVYGGVRLQSAANQSLVVKLFSAAAGFTANGSASDIADRIGGILQISGQPGFPVVLTSLRDDTVGAGFDATLLPQTDTNGDGSTTLPAAGNWNTILIDEFAHDRNVAEYAERELATSAAPGTNAISSTAESLGKLGQGESSGDENLRLGFDVQGYIHAPNDVDVYSFDAQTGTEIWVDIDNTSTALDTVVELIDNSGTILALSDDSTHVTAVTSTSTATNTATGAAPSTALTVQSTAQFLAGDTITIGSNAPVVIQTVNSGTSITLTTSSSWTAGSAVRLALRTGTTVHVSNSAVFKVGDSIRIGLNATSTTIATINSATSITLTAARTSRTGDVVVLDADIPYASPNAALILPNQVNLMFRDPTKINDSFTLNPRDAGFRVSLPGPAAATNTYFIRVRSSPRQAVGDPALNSLSTAALNAGVSQGKTVGAYQLQVRLRETQEYAGTTVQYSDIRYATNGLQVIGHPAHSLLTGEAAEPVDSYNVGNQQYAETVNTTTHADAQLAANVSLQLGNLLSSDRAALSAAGTISNAEGSITNRSDVNFFQFTVSYDNIAPFINGTTPLFVSTMFDIDYSDGLARGDLTLGVYDANGALIYIGRDSNIADDRPRPLNTNDLTDLSRGSVGQLDATIGPVYLPLTTANHLAPLSVRTYYVAVSSNSQVPAALDQFQNTAAASPLVRLEPVKSVARIAEDRIGASGGSTVAGATALPRLLFDSDSPFINGLGDAVDSRVPYHFGDVVLFVSSNTGAGGSSFRSVNPFTGTLTTTLGSAAGFNTGDLAVRSSSSPGAILTLSTGVPNTARTDGNAGNYLLIDPGTPILPFALTSQGDDGIVTITDDGRAPFNVAAGTLTVVTENVGIPFNAMAYDANGLLYAIGPRSSYCNVDCAAGSGGTANHPNLMFRLNATTGAVDATFNAAVAGPGPTGTANAGVVVNVPGNNQITGMTFYNGMRFAVTAQGDFMSVTNGGVVTIIGGGPINDPSTGNPAIFQGLTTPPQAVEGGIFAPGGLFQNTVIGITNLGRLIAFDTTTGALKAIFVDGQTNVPTGITNVVGLAFSNLDQNLWSTRNSLGRGGNTEHGIPAPPDQSVTTAQGGRSYYFGSGGNYNFPGGAHGSLVSNSFSLKGYSAADQPYLYFTYFLNGEPDDQDYLPGSRQQPDSFRVFAGGDDGDWHLLATNDSFRSNTQADEYNTYNLTGYPSASTNPTVQELYQSLTTGAWRQARIALAPFAGQENLRLRFDFATAGTMNIGDITTVGEELRMVDGDQLRDGDAITLDIGVAPAAGSTRFQQVFEYDLGYTLVVPSGDQIPQGSTVTINGVTFTFTKGPVVANPITALDTDSAETVVANIRTAVSVSGAGVTLANMVSAPVGTTRTFRRDRLNLPTVTVGNLSQTGLPATFIEGAPGTVHTNSTAVVVRADNSRNTVATVLQNRLALIYTGGTAPAQLALFKVDRDLVRIINHTVRFVTPESDTVGVTNDTLATAQNIDNRGWSTLNDANIGNSANQNTSTTFAHNTIMGQGDGTVDFYSFTVSNAGDIGIFDIDGLTDVTATYDFDSQLDLYDQFGTLLATNDNVLNTVGRGGSTNLPSPAGVDAFIQQTFATPGTYYIRVGNTGGGAATGAGVAIAATDRYTLNISVQNHVTNRGNVGYSIDSSTKSGGLDGDFTGNFFSNRRGQSNANEGVYIDDITIGFAERGEMVTNAPNNTSNFIDNVELLRAQWTGTHNENLQGPYQLEIRRGPEFANFDSNVSNYSGPPNLGLTTSWDTNDRLGHFVAITAPRGSEIGNSVTFNISDGVNTLTFEYDDLGTPGSVAAGNVAVGYRSTDTDATIAAAIVTAINSASVQNVFKGSIQARLADGTAAGNTNRVNLFGNAVANRNGTPLAPVTSAITAVSRSLDRLGAQLRYGDENRRREQGQIVVLGNTIRDSQAFGIVIDADGRTVATGGPPVPAGQGSPHPGSLRSLPELDLERLVPGVVIMNNVIARGGTGGIHYSGDPNTTGVQIGPVPFGRLVNNTIFGNTIATGTGLTIDDHSAPTLLNNIFANLATAVNVTNNAALFGAIDPNTVVLGDNYFQNNTLDLAGAANYGAFAFSDKAAVVAAGGFLIPGGSPLFVDALNSNFYLKALSPAIDSGLSSLDDRFDYANRVKQVIGISPSPVLAPERDLFGLKRFDDPSVNTPAGIGGNSFIDHGALERTDFAGPFARPIVLDDLGVEVVYDTTATVHQIDTIKFLRQFIVKLEDQGTGISDPTTDNDANFANGSPRVQLFQNGVLLTAGNEYAYSYNSNTNRMTLTSASTFPLDAGYRIVVDPVGGKGILDLAGNTFQGNQPDASSQFNFIVTNGQNDAPINTIPAQQALVEDGTLTLRLTNNNLISVTDPDAFLALANPMAAVGDGIVQVTLTVTNGTGTTTDDGKLTLALTTGLTFSGAGGNGLNEMTFTGKISDINAALNGLVFAPNQDRNDVNNTSTSTLSITTSDLGNSYLPLSPPIVAGPSNVTITVLPVNDQPTLDPIANQGQGAGTYPLVLEDDSSVALYTLNLTGIAAGPTAGLADATDEVAGQLITSITVTSSIPGFFTTLAVNYNTANLPADAVGTLDFKPAPNSSGLVTITMVVLDNGGNANGGLDSLTRQFTIFVTPVNDAPAVNCSGGPDSYLTNEDNALSVAAAGVLANDCDPNDTNPANQLFAVLRQSAGGDAALNPSSPPNNRTTPTANGSVTLFEDGRFTYTPNLNFNGTDTFTYRLIDDGGQSNGGNDGQPPNAPILATVTITVDGVNDAPVNTLPAAYTTNEDTAKVLNGISILDVDSAAGNLTVTLSVTSGTLTALTTGDGVTTGLLASQVTTNFTSSVVITAPQAAINAMLANATGLTFNPAPDKFGTVTLTMLTNDNGNTGTGPVGGLSDSDTTTITVNSVNDAPVGLADFYATNEDVPLTVLVGVGVLANDTDPSDTPPVGTGPKNNLTAVLVTGSANGGTLTLNPNGSFNYTPFLNFVGIDTFTYRVVDDGGVAFGGNDQGNIVTVSIDVGGINDAPVNTVPPAQTTIEDIPLVFNTSAVVTTTPTYHPGPNLISIFDSDENGLGERVTLSVTNGTLTLSTITGLVFTNGSGTADASMTFSGALVDINTALNGLRFLGNLNFHGAATLTITTNDLGNSGTGGAKSDTDTVAITILSSNDAPIALPDSYTASEDITRNVTAGLGVLFNDTDPNDTPPNLLSAILQGPGAVFVNANGSRTASTTANGSVTLFTDGSFSYTPFLNFFGTDTFTYQVRDAGGTANSGNDIGNTVTVTMTVDAVNDPPLNTFNNLATFPTALSPTTAFEDTPLILSNANGNAIQVTDVDALNGQILIDLTATDGVLTLNGTTGLTFLGGDGLSDAAMRFTGTLINVNAALNGMTFNSTPNFNTTNTGRQATINVTVNDQGNTGQGSANVDSDTVFINVVSVNDAPLGQPDSYSTDEDTTLIVPASGVLGNDSDPLDTPANVLSASLISTTTKGVLTFNANGGFTYVPNPSYSGPDSFSYRVTDNGGTAFGGNNGTSPLNPAVTVTISVNPVNDAPVNTVPGAQSILEEATLVFGAGSLISTSDVDDLDDTIIGNETVQVTLTAASGTVTLGSTAGLAFTTGNGTANSTMTFSGTLTNVNAALVGTSFTPAINFVGTASLTVTTNDLGNTGTGGPQSDTDSISIAVANVNDPPVASPDSYSVNEDNTLVVSAVAGLLANDNDSADTPQNSLTANVVSGVGNGTLTFIGNGSFTYVPNGNFSGADSFTYRVTDNGGLAFGGNDGTSPLNPTVTVTISVSPVNDAPVNGIPAAQTTSEDTAKVFNLANGNLISLADIDAGGSTVQVTLTGANGTVTLGGTVGLAFTAGNGTANATMTFTGTISAINTALNGLSFTPSTDFVGSASLTMTTNDQGNTGSGGALSDTDVINITVNSVNDPPVAVADNYATNEDAPLIVNAGQGVLANDGDPKDTPANVLSATKITDPLQGTLVLNTDGSFTYTPTADYTGPDSFTYQVSDNGGGSNIGNTVTVNLTVNPVNDAPVNVLPVAAQSTNEDTTKMFSTGLGNAISVADVDIGAGPNPVRVTLTVTNGTLTLATISGLTFSTGTGTANTTMTFTGAIASINTALNGLSYTPVTNFNGTAALTITTNDQGNIGSGGALSDSDTLNITVNSVNDPPVGLPENYSTSEDTPLTVIAAQGVLVNDSDPLDVPTNGLSAILISATTAANGTVSLNANGSFTYTPAADFNGSDSFTYRVTDNGGTAFGGNDGTNPLNPPVTVTISVSPVNDSPVNVVPGTQTLLEEGTLVFSTANGNRVSTSDIDVAAGNVQVTLTAVNGLVTLGSTVGVSFSTGNGTANSTMTFSGTLANVNTALAGTSFTPPANFAGAASLSVTTNDFGNTGTGGAQSDTDLILINVTNINDAPVALPDSYSVNEDNTLTVLVAAGVLANDTDPLDSPTDTLNASKLVDTANGLLTLNSDGSFTYVPNANFNGTDSFTYRVGDSGGTLNGGNNMGNTVTVTIAVSAVNDAPVNGVPGTQTTLEDTTRLFNAGNGNLISVADVDVAGNPVRVTLTGSNGTFSLGGTAGLTFTTGDGTSDAAMTFTGTLTSVNTALTGLAFAPSSNFAGTATLTMTTTDQGSTGAGGALSDTDTISITVTGVNDVPIGLTENYTLSEDTPLSVSAAQGVLANDGDPNDTPSNTLSAVKITDPLQGTLSLNADGSFTYTPVANYNGLDSFQYQVQDNGGISNGGSNLGNTVTVNLTVTAVNDAPVNSLPAAQSTNEDFAKIFSGGLGNAISILDVDAGAGLERVTLTATNGTLSLGSIAGLAFSTGNGTANSTMTFTGTTVSVNTALNGMSFTPATNFNGTATLTITTNDQGNSGSGGTLSDTDTVNITVNAVNDPPVNGVPGTQTTNDEDPVTFSAANANAITLTDVDAGNAVVRLSLTPLNGSITMASTNGLTLIQGDGASGTGFVYEGTLSNLNAAINGLVFRPTTDFHTTTGPTGAATLTVSTDDKGNSGLAGIPSDTDIITVTVNDVNDAPINNVPVAQSVLEDGALVFNTANNNRVSITDVDDRGGVMRLVLTTVNGTLSLGSTTGVVFLSGNGVQNTSMSLIGTRANLDSALDGLTFRPNANFNGSASITMTTDDQGNSGLGGALSDTNTVALTVTSVNDLPTIANSTPALRIALAGDPFTLNYATLLAAVGAADVDVGEVLQLQVVQVSSGTLKKGGVLVTPGVTSIGPGESLVWTPPANVNDSLAAFVLRAVDSANAGSVVTATVTIDVTTIVRYLRSYNPVTDYHFFTMSVSEFNNAVSALGYRDENTGRPGFEVATGEIPVQNPAQRFMHAIHRLYNPNNNRHYYTANSDERDFLVRLGYRYEKDEGFIFTQQVLGTVPIFRLYNTLSGTHLLTESVAQRDAILAQFPGIWVRHSDFGFAYPVSASGQPPVLAVARAAALAETSSLSPFSSTSSALTIGLATLGSHDQTVSRSGADRGTIQIDSPRIGPLVSTSQSAVEDRPFTAVQSGRTAGAKSGTVTIIDSFWEQVGRQLELGVGLADELSDVLVGQ